MTEYDILKVILKIKSVLNSECYFSTEFMICM